jgi:hypothetical protein
MEALEEQVNYLHLSSSAAAHRSIEVMRPSVQNTESVVLAIDDRTRALDMSAKSVATSIDGLRASAILHERTTQSLRKGIEMQSEMQKQESERQRQRDEWQTQTTVDAISSLSSLLQGIVESNKCMDVFEIVIRASAC